MKCPNCGYKLWSTGWGDRQSVEHPTLKCNVCKRKYWEVDGKPSIEPDKDMPRKRCGL